MENSKRLVTQKFSVELKRVKKWRENFEKIFSTKSSKQRIEGGVGKCQKQPLELFYKRRSS